MRIVQLEGDWKEMGRKLAEATGEDIVQRQKWFFPDGIPQDAPRLVDRLVGLMEEYTPGLLAEIQGQADALNLTFDRCLLLRLGADARAMHRHAKKDRGCSSFFTRPANGNPLLGRTCDIEAAMHHLTSCIVRRPTGATPTLTTALGTGMNAHGVGLTLVSAHEQEPGTEDGIPQSLLLFAALQKAQRTEDVLDMLRSTVLLGKGATGIVADAEGDSAIIELPHGRPPHVMPRPKSRSWDVVSNFFSSTAVPTRQEPAYLYNAYARYGIMLRAFALQEGVEDCPGAEELLRRVAQPGPNIPEGACSLTTAYATVFDLKNRLARVSPANPNTSDFRTVPLMND